jgi:hypothetical protein
MPCPNRTERPQMHSVGLLLLTMLFAMGLPATSRAEAARVAVLDFELNDLTLDPNNPEEVARTASIKGLLEGALTSKYGYQIVTIDAKSQGNADRGVGYLFDRPDVAADLGRTVGAKWIVVGRVHKASFLFVYFKVHLINVATGAPAADLVVEVKGPQRKLTVRGIETLAQQIAEAISRESSQQR